MNWKMHHAYNEKKRKKKRYKRRNRTTQSGKQIYKKRNLPIPGTIISRCDQVNGNWILKNRREYLKKRRKHLETKIFFRNPTYAVYFLKYSGPFLKWTCRELRHTELRERELRMMHKVLHIDRLFVSMCQEKKVEENSPELRNVLM